jgi:hypothetical protein
MVSPSAGSASLTVATLGLAGAPHEPQKRAPLSIR